MTNCVTNQPLAINTLQTCIFDDVHCTKLRVSPGSHDVDPVVGGFTCAPGNMAECVTPDEVIVNQRLGGTECRGGLLPGGNVEVEKNAVCSPFGFGGSVRQTWVVNPTPQCDQFGPLPWKTSPGTPCPPCAPGTPCPPCAPGTSRPPACPPKPSNSNSMWVIIGIIISVLAIVAIGYAIIHYKQKHKVGGWRRAPPTLSH